MKILKLQGGSIINGEGSLEYLRQVEYKKAMIITGSKSMFASGVIGKIEAYMKKPDTQIHIYGGIGKNPTKEEVYQALHQAREFKPDVVIAVGGGSPMDAAKAVVLFYEFPDLNFDNVFSTKLPEKREKVRFIAIPSTSGTASEVTHVTVITYPEEKVKRAIRSDCLRPDITILDGTIPQTLPPHIVAETGMDALTHALECYINKNGDEFTDALAKEAIEGILYWLPISYEKATLESRQKMHAYQCMAGMAFSNAGLGIVHGVSHAFGGMYDTAHGLANAIILPYSMDYNKKDAFVADKYQRLSRAIGKDIIFAVKKLSEFLGISQRFKDIGIAETAFKEAYEILVKNSLGGSTVVNPIVVSEADMRKFVSAVYYGYPVDF